MNKQLCKQAFIATLPVLSGYVVLGTGFGILLQSKGYAWWWAAVMSLTIYAGSMQYAAVDLLTGGLLWNCPEWAMCLRLECRGSICLVSDTLDGSVCLFHLERPWERQTIVRFADSQACFV